MNQPKFNLSDTITIIAAIIYGFFCYLSLNFFTFGDTSTSVTVAVIITLVLAGLAFTIKSLKGTSKNFKQRIIWEKSLLVVFILFGLLSFLLFGHYFGVSAQKEDIKKVALQNVAKSETIFQAYETYANNRLDTYESRLNSVVMGKTVNPSLYSDYDFKNGISDTILIKSKLFMLKSQLYPTNYKSMRKEDSTWIADSKDKISSWSKIGIVSVLKTIDSETSSWIITLNKFSRFKAKGESSNDFDFPLQFADVSDRFTNRKNPTIFASLLGLGLLGLMLFSYFITNRHSKSIGVPTSINVKEDNEL